MIARLLLSLSAGELHVHGWVYDLATGKVQVWDPELDEFVVPDEWVLADPVDPFIKRIRAGFILLQAGMAFGLIRDCLRLIEQCKGPLGHVNKYLDVQAEPLAEQLEAMEVEVARLAATPFEWSDFAAANPVLAVVLLI